MSIIEVSIKLDTPIVIEPINIDDFVENDLISPLTTEWWEALVASGHTLVQETDLCDHGFTLDQINMYLHKLEGPNDMIIKAYFSYVYGLNRLIEDTFSNDKALLNFDSIEISRIFAICKITATHCAKWGFHCKVMNRMYEIFGLARVIFELIGIRSSILCEYQTKDIISYRREYINMCHKYNIKISMKGCYSDT